MLKTRWFAAPMLALTLLSVPACKTLGTPPTGDVSPDAQHARLAEMAKVASLAEKAVDLIAAIQQTEIEVYKAKLVPNYTAEQHEATQGGFVKFAQEAQRDLQIAKDTSQTDATRRTAVASLSKRGKEFVATIQIDNPLVRASVDAAFVVIDMLNLTVV